MPSEVDINLIFLKIEKFEERLQVLEADVKNLKPYGYYQAKAQNFRARPLTLEESSDNNPGASRPFISNKELMK